MIALQLQLSMMARFIYAAKKIPILLGAVSKAVASEDDRSVARVRKEDLTRNRNLLFEDVLVMNIRGYYHGLANE